MYFSERRRNKNKVRFDIEDSDDTEQPKKISIIQHNEDIARNYNKLLTYANNLTEENERLTEDEKK